MFGNYAKKYFPIAERFIIMTRKQSFIVYASWEDNLDGLSLKQRGMILNSMFEYSKTGIKPQITDPVVRTAFNGIAAQMELNAAKYADTCEKNAKNAMRRWENRAKKADATVCDGNENDADKCIMKNDNVNDIENDNENVIDIIKDKTPAPSAAEDVRADAGGLDENENENDNENEREANGPREIHEMKLFGGRHNVKMTQEEYDDLVGEYGEAVINKHIDCLSDHIALGAIGNTDDCPQIIRKSLRKSGVKTLAEMQKYYDAAKNHQLRF